MKKMTLLVLAVVMLESTICFSQDRLNFRGELECTVTLSSSITVARGELIKRSIRLQTFQEKCLGTIDFYYTNSTTLREDIGVMTEQPDLYLDLYFCSWIWCTQYKFFCNKGMIQSSHANRGPLDDPYYGPEDHTEAATDTFKGVAFCDVEIMPLWLPPSTPAIGEASLDLKGTLAFNEGESYPYKVRLSSSKLLFFGKGDTGKVTFSSVLFPIE